MNESEALSLMVPPGQKRAGKWRGGVIQIHLTRACDKACFNCTQGSQYTGKPTFISPDNFEIACQSLKDYFGVVGVFGGNPAMHPNFQELCDILTEHIPKPQRGLWCNNPISEEKGEAMRRTFNPAVSNLNVHLDKDAYLNFKKWWPECHPFGLDKDSRHSPVYVSPRDLNVPEAERWELISRCDINQHWSAMICEVGGELRGFFCEIAGAMAMLAPPAEGGVDAGMPVTKDWWKQPMEAFGDQVFKYCHDCAVPLKGRGELACAGDEGKEQTSDFWSDIAQPKRQNREVEIVTTLGELKAQSLARTTDYMGNARR